MLFLAMQVRVMAACMESQIDKQEYTASAQSRARDGTGGISQPSNVCGGYQVFCEDLNSNSVFKLFILIWSYEGMKVMNSSFVKSNGKLSITLKFNVFIMLV